jgi:hypothetical protein
MVLAAEAGTRDPRMTMPKGRQPEWRMPGRADELCRAR